MAKNRKREGRRLAARNAVRQRLRVQQAEFEEQGLYRRGARPAVAVAAIEVRTPFERRLDPVERSAGLTSRQAGELRRLARVAERTKLVDARTRGRDGLPEGVLNTYLGGLAQLAKRYRSWIREPEGWKRRTHNRERQFGSLARYLLVEYPVPSFLDEAWFSGDATHQRWFMRVGRGYSLRREPSLPIPMSKRMVHEFLSAPSSLGVVQAVRWSQAVAMGASPRMARALVGTRLGRSFEHEAFWSTVVQFLVRHTMLDTNHYGPIVDFVYNQRFVAPEPAIVNGRRVEYGPPQPLLSMQGRTPESILRAVHAWHQRLTREHARLGATGGRELVWTASGVPGVVQTEGVKGERRWVVRELLSSTELVEEGREMGHCVATYVDSCAARNDAIFSMLYIEKQRVDRRVTIDVDLSTKRIVEVSGKFNRAPSEQERRVLSSWAAQAGLTLSEWV